MDSQEKKTYYRHEVLKNGLFLALFVLILALSALFLMLWRKHIGFTELGEMSEVIIFCVFAVLVLMIILIGMRINEIVRLQDAQRGIIGEERKMKARLIYGLTFGFGALIFLFVLLYIFAPRFQLEMDRGPGSRVVMEKEVPYDQKDPGQGTSLVCIVENHGAVTVDVYDGQLKKWLYAPGSSKDMRWSYNTVHIISHEYVNGWMTDTWWPYYLVSARCLPEQGFSGTIEVDEPFYKTIDVGQVPYGDGFIQYAYSLIDIHEAGASEGVIDIAHWWDLIEAR